MTRLLFFFLSLTITVYSQSILKHNEVSFPNGAGFTDEISANLPVSTIPVDTTYDDYLSYIYGFSVFDIGTVNVSGGAGKSIIFGNWLGEEVPEGDNVYSGIRGLTTEGKMGADYSGGAIVDSEQNAFSDLQVGKTLTTQSVWFRSDTNNKNQIDSYGAIDISYAPSNQLGLGLQAEGGDLIVQDQFYVDSSEGRVGIGTSEPSAELHVEGDIKADGLYGVVGKIATTTYYSKISDIDINSTYFKICYEETFTTTGWGTDMDALAFVSFSAHMQDGVFVDNLMLYVLSIHKTEDAPLTTNDDIIAKSGAATFDSDDGAQDRDFTLFVGATLEPDTEYTLLLVGNSGSGKNGQSGLTITVDISNISGFVYALPSQ